MSINLILHDAFEIIDNFSGLYQTSFSETQFIY